MRFKQIPSAYVSALWLCLVTAMLASCVPTSAPTAATALLSSSPSSTPLPKAATAVLGCSAGGLGLFSPEDVRCYLANADPTLVQRIDEETLFLLGDPQSIADWVGAAIIYHVPTVSTLVLDRFGDVDPQASLFGNRAGLAALSQLAGNAELMAGLKRQVLSRWQTTPSNEPEIRLGIAWQDGPTTVFLIAIAGLEATDDRFYCPGQTWTVGDSIVEIAADCMAYEAGTPVNHFFFESRPIKGSSERPVQVALDGVPSNVVHVREAPVGQETLIYQAVLQQITNRPLIVRGETVAGFDEDSDQLLKAVVPSLLQDYLAVNKTPYSLRFLFQDSGRYFVQPEATIARDYLPDNDTQPACALFRSDYPGLGGVVTLSRIGFSDDGAQALVHVRYECGTADHLAAYYSLASSNDSWQVTDTFSATIDLPQLTPEMDYVNKANGCGDIFVYKSNRARSEYVKVYIDAKAFDLSVKSVTLDLAAHSQAIGAWIDVYADSVEKLGENPYCNDVGPTAEPQSIWQAASGSVTVSVSGSAQTEPCAGEPYQATVLIEDVIFALGEERVHLPSSIFDDVTVGWCAG